ncbi:hypothetical protein AB6A40_002717 [Gnathostoma spinigerum]|uniref:Uncharacterized protein n=1 Tax=Gnathostoma spinigerum TaxID=75299 RepID=A0ABD6E7I0_9BILA
MLLRHSFIHSNYRAIPPRRENRHSAMILIAAYLMYYFHPICFSNSWLIQFFRVSYQYYSLISVTVAIVVAHCVQFLVGNHMEVDHRLISPLLRKFLPGKCDESTVSGRKSSVNIRKSGVETCELHEAVPLNKGCSTEPEL